MKKYGSWIALSLFVLQISLLIGLDAMLFYKFSSALYYAACAFLVLLTALTVFFYNYLCGRKTGANLLFTLISVILCPCLTVILGAYLLSDILLLGSTDVILIVTCLSAPCFLTYFILSMIKVADKNVLRKAVAGGVAAIFFAGLAIPVCGYIQFHYKAPTVSGLGQYAKAAYPLQADADIFVSTAGNDETGTGSFDAPFKTIEKARQKVRSMDKSNRNGITVAIKAGIYRVDSLCFEIEDGGTENCPVTYCAYGDGEVVINGGVTLNAKDFTPIPDGDMKNRLSQKARNNVVCLNLSSYGITAEQYGKICAIGSYNTARKYDGDYVGPIYSELFFNDTRMNLARYPDEGFLKTGTVVEMGKGLESDGNKTADPEYWENVRNPKSDTYALSPSLTKRIASWKTLDDVWMFGFWKYTWADASTPIGEFSEDKKTLTTKFVSNYGAIKNAPYYFFNVFEELDAPGEWYLNRQSGVLYMYPLGSMETAVLDLSLTTEPVLKVNASNITFKNLTIKGSRGDGMVVTGNNDVVTLCTIKNIGGSALSMNGYNNLASENEVAHTGKGGIHISGGDRTTLTKGESRAHNNLIHDFSEIYLTYQPAVTLSGVGNICSHNEIYNSPHEAISYSGNYHYIEYNNVHDVCLLSDDAGAIYAGKHWDYYGNVIRYNAVYNLGSDGHHPCGIYMDDALSGQTVYGNLLVNVPDISIELGGGRDLVVQNNLIINAGARAVSYDRRARSSALESYEESMRSDGELWKDLEDALTEAPILKTAFPQINAFSYDFSDMDNPNFIPNPANSIVSGNVIIRLFAPSANINEDAYRFSTIENNPEYSLTKASSLFVDYKNGDYRLKSDCAVFKDLPGFEALPISEIGRCAHNK